MYNQNLGRLGEKIASDYLRKKGYQILEFNFQARYGEIDIVTSEGDTLVFVEVKTRIGDYYGEPADAILPKKMHEVIKTAEFYLLKNKIDPDWRIDVVAISLNTDESVSELEHFENVTL